MCAAMRPTSFEYVAYASLVTTRHIELLEALLREYLA